ncbi:MAG: hypothetical protein ACLSA6_01215 [Holdemania massiliensis]
MIRKTYSPSAVIFAADAVNRYEKSLPTIIHSSALELETILFSGDKWHSDRNGSLPWPS